MLGAPVARVKNPLRTRLPKAAMTQDDCTDLRQRVIRLEDIERARGFMFTYAETVDDADPETVAGLFRQDGLLSTSRGVARGRAEIRAFFEKAFAADNSRKRHFVVNLRATWLEEGLVRVQSYFHFVGRLPESSVLGWGRYDDTVDVAGERPCFAAKTIELDLRTDLDRGWATDEGEA
jgi:3-phenylpropionate/cinnamic acid dioxygenase small subunit